MNLPIAAEKSMAAARNDSDANIAAIHRALCEATPKQLEAAARTAGFTDEVNYFEIQKMARSLTASQFIDGVRGNEPDTTATNRLEIKSDMKAGAMWWPYAVCFGLGYSFGKNVVYPWLKENVL